MTVQSCRLDKLNNVRKSESAIETGVVQNQALDKRHLSEKVLIAKGFNKQAKQYDQHSQVQQDIALHALALLPKLSDTVARVQCIVDLGCGTGAYLAYLLELADITIGIDVSRNMLKQAQTKAKSLSNVSEQHQSVFINADAEVLPLKSTSVDIVFSSMALQWCFNPAQLLAEVHRVLKQGGKATLAILVDGSFKGLHLAYQTLGIPSRVNQFASSSTWLQAASQLNWQVDHSEASHHTQHTSLLDMLQSIKRVGANTKQANVAQCRINIHDESSGVKHHNVGLNSFMSRAEIKQLTSMLIADANRKTALENHTKKYLKTNNKSTMLLDYRVMFLELSK